MRVTNIKAVAVSGVGREGLWLIRVISGTSGVLAMSVP